MQREWKTGKSCCRRETERCRCKFRCAGISFVCYLYAAFTLCSRRPRQSRFRPPWSKRDGREITRGDGMDKRDRPWLPWMPGQIFKLSKKSATAATVRMRNLAGRSKTGWTQQNVTVRNMPQQNLEALRSGTGSILSPGISCTVLPSFVTFCRV